MMVISLLELGLLDVLLGLLGLLRVDLDADALLRALLDRGDEHPAVARARLVDDVALLDAAELHHLLDDVVRGRHPPDHGLVRVLRVGLGQVDVDVVAALELDVLGAGQRGVVVRPPRDAEAVLVQPCRPPARASRTRGSRRSAWSPCPRSGASASSCGTVIFSFDLAFLSSFLSWACSCRRNRRTGSTGPGPARTRGRCEPRTSELLASGTLGEWYWRDTVSTKGTRHARARRQRQYGETTSPSTGGTV